MRRHRLFPRGGLSQARFPDSLSWFARAWTASRTGPSSLTTSSPAWMAPKRRACRRFASRTTNGSSPPWTCCSTRRRRPRGWAPGNELAAAQASAATATASAGPPRPALASAQASRASRSLPGSAAPSCHATHRARRPLIRRNRKQWSFASAESAAKRAGVFVGLLDHARARPALSATVDGRKGDGRSLSTVCGFPGVGIRGDCGFSRRAGARIVGAHGNIPGNDLYSECRALS